MYAHSQRVSDVNQLSLFARIDCSHNDYGTMHVAYKYVRVFEETKRFRRTFFCRRLKIRFSESVNAGHVGRCIIAFRTTRLPVIGTVGLTQVNLGTKGALLQGSKFISDAYFFFDFQTYLILPPLTMFDRVVWVAIELKRINFI